MPADTPHFRGEKHVIRQFLHQYLEPYRGLPKNVWLISLTLLVNRSGTMVLPFLVLYIKEVLELSDHQTGALMGLYGLGAIIGSYLGGALTTRWGPVTVQIVSLALSGVGFLALLLADGMQTMGVGLFLLAVVADAYRPAAATATAESCAAYLHPRAFALNRLAINLGMSIGPVMGGFLADYNFNLLFVLDAMTCFIAAVLTAWLLRGRIPSGKSAANAPALRSTATGVWNDLPALTSIFLMFLCAVVFFQAMSTYTVHLEHAYGMSKSAIGLLFAINTIMIVFAEMGLVRAVERYRRLRVLAWGCLLSCIGIGLIGFGNSLHWAVASMIILTVGEMLSSPMAAAYINSRATSENRGAYLGWFTLSFAAAHATAPVLGMWAYGWHPRSVWLASFVIGGICFSGYWILDRSDAPDIDVPHSDRVQSLQTTELQ